jgi:hypothetical protein
MPIILYCMYNVHTVVILCSSCLPMPRDISSIHYRMFPGRGGTAKNLCPCSRACTLWETLSCVVWNNSITPNLFTKTVSKYSSFLHFCLLHGLTIINAGISGYCIHSLLLLRKHLPLSSIFSYSTRKEKQRQHMLIRTRKHFHSGNNTGVCSIFS